ncbi:hypothetical protein AYO21_02288 [Fonsecaea monophora]|uniref:Uncharacterized protein n=1 Tax=Fonsecaea monophora TaxID=254056 RepID=A0A177FHX8_9EURO|nr:hypothetical protein AYO21_02288 [Fonsecaea monophora]OAG43351.1 hypothetical protein AYO21_02288 [Fonsecaea monophora]
MPHKSVRRTLGIEPPDLYREHWHPDRKNIEREKCKVFRKEQKLLICELQDDLPSSSSYTTTTLSSSSPRKWSSFSPIRRLFKRSKRHRRSQATSQGDRSRSNMTPRYKIVGKIYPSDKSTGVFKSVPAGFVLIDKTGRSRVPCQNLDKRLRPLSELKRAYHGGRQSSQTAAAPRLRRVGHPIPAVSVASFSLSAASDVIARSHSIRVTVFESSTS